MKIFTVRDLDRTPSKVLRACEVEGIALVKARNGSMYEIRPHTAPFQKVNSKWLNDHRAWLETRKAPRADAVVLNAVDELVAG